jgi:alpha-1,3-rhamnosyl/mannosyltransferase
LESKKNIQNLIKGYAQLADKSWPLVLAGRPGNFGYEEILELAAAVSNIRFLGYIPQTDYAPLLAAASLFVFPSKFEGFGIPVLEAMGSGVPVACSDLPVLREVAGDSAVFFNPDESRAIAGALQQLINQKDLRQDLVAKGLERAQKFSWEKCAQETWEYIVS